MDGFDLARVYPIECSQLAHLFGRANLLHRALCHLLYRLLRRLRLWILLQRLLPLPPQQLRPLPLQLVHLLLRNLPDDRWSLRLLLFLETGLEFLFALRGGHILLDEFLLLGARERGGGEELFGAGVVGVLGEGFLAFGERGYYAGERNISMRDFEIPGDVEQS